MKPRRSPKLVRRQVQVTPELQAFAEEHYPIRQGAKITEGFSWSDAQGHRRRMRLHFDDGLQLDANFGAVRDGEQTIGNFRMKWSLVARKEQA